MKRIIHLPAVLILACISVSLAGQNLLENPGFESPEGWDKLWVLSTIDPSSSSAIAEPVLSDVHEGGRSVRITNSVKLKWTYLYSDSVNAPITLRAGKRYEVKGWIKVLEMGKETDLSIYWNGAKESLSFYNQNPDPATQPDWFMVMDTIYPQANCSDGYLRLGFRTDKAGLFPTGNLLMDDFSLERIPEDSDADILNIELEKQATPAQIDYFSSTIRLAVASGTNVSDLVLELIEVSPGAAVTPAAGEVIDFSNPANFLVTGKDGVTTQDWSVEVEVLPSSETDILEFKVPGQSGLTGIDPARHLVDIHVPFGSDVNALIPEISTSTGATIDPAPGIEIDFSAPVEFTVTAEDGTTRQIWTVTVSETAPSVATEIVLFEFDNQIGSAQLDGASHSVAVQVPYGTDLSMLVPNIEVSAGAVIDPGSGVESDFSAPVVYTVTAQDGTTRQDWTVTVLHAPNSAAEITGFAVPGQQGRSAIETDAQTVVVEVPYGTDLTALVPDIEVSAGAVIDPGSGVAADFTAPVVYTVTAQDGTTTRAWTVQVILLANTAADILGFTLAVQEGETLINHEQKVVTVRVPDQTDVTSLVPAIELSFGARVNPAGGIETDFTNPVVYVVTAADGVTTEVWIVQVVVLENTAAEITGFSLPEQTGPATIDTAARTIAIEVNAGTDLTALAPVIELSAGATVNPASGEVMDFSSWVILTVIAGDGVTEQEWLVNVTVASEATGTDHLLQGSIRVYPNPANGYMVVETGEMGEIVIQDLNGRIVKRVLAVNSSTTVSVSDLERGIYFVTIQTGTKRTVVKVVLE
jgi:hypothetical protein